MSKLLDILNKDEHVSESSAATDTPNASFNSEELSKVLNLMSTEELRAFIKRSGIPRLQQSIADQIKREEAYAAQQTMDVELTQAEDQTQQQDASVVPFWLDRARVIPLRLTEEERRQLLILDRALKTSEYTDKVDVYIRGGSRNEVIAQEIEAICAIVSGLVVAQGIAKPKPSNPAQQSSRFDSSVDTFLCRKTFEIGRRYKMMNPERMREYGKLMWVMQDSRRLDSGETFIDKVLTIKDFLVANEAEDILRETRLMKEAVESASVFARSEAVRLLSAKHPSLDVSRIVESFRDYRELRHQLVHPLDVMIGYLDDYFQSESVPGIDQRLTNLSISSGRNGARLNHNHNRQYLYVSQSLKLWREVLGHFLQLWHYAESDLLSEGVGYRLMDTGQGLNRVQSCPKLGHAMARVLDKVQNQLGGWVGSSAIHLGDHNVPNSLFFIDKYSQIPRILRPIAHCLNQLDKEYERWGGVVRDYIDRTFGGAEKAKRAICADFFKHGFDGSGADNFFDAGSCIDGRLTSAWNWCSQIEKKPYFPLFLLTGFVGFDGDQGW